MDTLNHRELGQRMNLFAFPDHAEGGVAFEERGVYAKRTLVNFLRDHLAKHNYREVETAELNKLNLWKESGHYDEFGASDEMFYWEQRGRDLGLRPMNCANHANLFKSKTRSYRDLPLRIAEFGRVFRNEGSGALSGLMRLRSFVIDDGHVFVRPDQVQAELVSILSSVKRIIEHFQFEITFHLEGYAGRPPEAVPDCAESKLRDAAAGFNFALEDHPGDAAFYGPKIAVDVEDAAGRSWTLGTVQLDYVIPKRLDLEYVNESGNAEPVVMIHRAYLGSLERFLGILLEHTQGLPVWLHSEPAVILPIADSHREYARSIQKQVNHDRVRTASPDKSLGKRLREAHKRHVPYQLIVGDDEVEANTITVKVGDKQKSVPVQKWGKHLDSDCERRSFKPTLPD